MTAAVTAYTLGAVLAVMLIVMAAMALAIYRLAVNRSDTGDYTPPDPAATVWDATVAVVGHPDNVDTTMPAFVWPDDPTREGEK